MKSLITIIFVTICFFSFSQRTRNCTEVITIESTYLKESRDVWIGLPDNYDSTKSYPTLFVLDAEWWFDITYSLTKELYQNQDKCPEMIVVGIPNIDRKHRVLDMTFTDSKNNASGEVDSIFTWRKSETGRGLNLLSHIEKEIIPYVNSTYSTSELNSIMGHSLGGYYCAYIIPIQKSFSNFFIYDASIWYNYGDAIKHIKKKLPKDYKTNIYIASGLKFDGPDIMVRNHLNKIDSLKELLQTYPNINLGTKTYANETHLSMYFYSVIDGLTYLFSD